MTIFVTSLTIPTMKPDKCLNVIADGVQFEEGVAVSKEVDVSLDKEHAEILHQWLGIYLDKDKPTQEMPVKEPKYYIHVVQRDQEGADAKESYVNYRAHTDEYFFNSSAQTYAVQTQFTQAEIDDSPYLKKLEGFKVLVTK